MDGDSKRGWFIYNTGSRTGINWSLVERFEQKKFENKAHFFLYRKQRSELMCECVDGDECRACEKCYGTGFEGGWVFAASFPAIDVAIAAQEHCL